MIIPCFREKSEKFAENTVFLRLSPNVIQNFRPVVGCLVKLGLRLMKDKTISCQ